jgi:hypothetical protein
VASERQRRSNLGLSTNPFVIPSPYWKGYSQKADERLAEQLFLGRTVQDKTGRKKIEHFTKDSADERSAREALARLLLRDNCPFVIKALVHQALTDGESERRLVFQYRKKGNRPDVSADLQVALYVLQLGDDRVKKESAVHGAMQKFGLSRKAVFECIKRAKKHYPVNIF